MHKYLTGEHLSFVPAPPRELLVMFGGTLDIDEYRAAVENKKIYKFVRYPLFVSRDYVKEIDIKNIKEANDYIFKAPTVKNKLIDISKFLQPEKKMN
jgi:hypothetical protein